MRSDAFDRQCMARALALASQGAGSVEPNPMVGCVVARDGEIIAEGFHERFGGAHAEVNALGAAGDRASGATVYVTLEPCCHHGKTPPCTEALIGAGVERVVVAVEDPFPQVRGNGIAALRAAGIQCEVGLCAAQAGYLLAPYRKLVTSGRPWVIAKWAMTLDGKIATRTGDSKWISSEASRARVHQMRGRMDAVLIGSGTAAVDDPLLTARPAELADLKRVPVRVVIDSRASLSPDSRLARTARDVPTLLACAPDAPNEHCSRLAECGVEVVRCDGSTHEKRLEWLLDELGRRRMTNVLVEGGSHLLAAFFEAGALDEVHVFIAPKLVGGAGAPSPLAGSGVEAMRDALPLADLAIEELEGDTYIHGRLR